MNFCNFSFETRFLKKIKTAAELDLHRNTIKYRVSQISQIIGLELGENMDSFPLLRSLDILKYMGITG